MPGTSMHAAPDHAVVRLPEAVLAALVRIGLVPAGATPPATPLPGGVSSDIWRVDLADGPVCVKRALPRLRVAQVWDAPVERNDYELAWLRLAHQLVPGCVPRVLAADARSHLFVMEYLPPSDYVCWKQQLAAGNADRETGRDVARILLRLHELSDGDEAIAARFDSYRIFEAIRIEPYLLATARVHPSAAAALASLAAENHAHQRALVHGDVSPKNILLGANGPVLVDAECACFGDPAFDLAFVLNHLLLKCLLAPTARDDLMACFEQTHTCYFDGVSAEPAAQREARVARLLPGLMLARIDGKSPVEYLRSESERECVRTVALRLLLEPPARLTEIATAWKEAIG